MSLLIKFVQFATNVCLQHLLTPEFPIIKKLFTEQLLSSKEDICEIFCGKFIQNNPVDFQSCDCE